MFNLTKEKINEYKISGQKYIDNISKKKYCINEEKNYNDVLNLRTLPTISNLYDKKTFENISEMFLEKRSIPAGSIIYGLGNTERKTSLSNCYFIPINEDSIEGIYDACKEMARTYSWRGGCGTDITILRPKGSSTKNSSKSSTGAVSFMPTFEEVTCTIGQNGRRGALIISLDIRHPDVLDFIWSKSKPEKIFGVDNLSGKTKELSSCNISVKVTNSFMEAVISDKNFDLIFPDFSICKDLYDKEWDGNLDNWLTKKYPIKVYKTVSARQLLKQIAESSWLSGDPGILFWDNVIYWSSGRFDKLLVPWGVNPCGEQPLQKYGNCLLSSLVMYKYVNNPYTVNAEFNIDLFEKDIKHLVIFLDSMIDINEHPLEKQNITDKYGRRIGCEITGLADMCSMLNMEYCSNEFLEFIDNLYYIKTVIEINTSIELAKTKGCAPCFIDKDKRIDFLKQPYIQRILKKMLSSKKKVFETDIKRYGLRNSAFNTIGPTGTISILCDNCSSGIEPVWKILYNRDGMINNIETIFHYPLIKYGNLERFENITEEEIKKKFHYKTAFDIDYKSRIKLQSILQKWTDASISSTINLPNSATIEDIYNIYIEAFKSNLKGITIFRDESKKSIFSSIDKNNTIDDINVKHSEIRKIISDFLPKIKKQLREPHRSYRYIAKWLGEDVYSNIVLGKDDHPMEIFTKIPEEVATDKNTGMLNEGLYADYMSNWDSLCRLVSIGLRAGIPLDNIIKQLDKSSKLIGSIPSIISRLLKNTISLNGNFNIEETKEKIKSGEKIGDYCYSCKNNGLVHENGCTKCVLCGWSKCG